VYNVFPVDISVGTRGIYWGHASRKRIGLATPSEPRRPRANHLIIAPQLRRELLDPKIRSLSAIPTPPLYRTEPKQSEADQAEGAGFGNGRLQCRRLEIVHCDRAPAHRNVREPDERVCCACRQERGDLSEAPQVAPYPERRKVDVVEAHEKLKRAGCRVLEAECKLIKRVD
jgi:hypothetical protein